MSTITPSKHHWQCTLGRHHYIPVHDDNPENRKSYHLECTRCRHFKEVDQYEPTDGSWLAKGNLTGF